MKYKYTHWLKIEDDMVKKVWMRLKEYKKTYDCNMKVFYKDGNYISKYIKLECNQSYQDLDLDVNSMSDEGLKHLSCKPKDIYQYNYPIGHFFKRNIGEAFTETMINENNINEYRNSIESNYQDSIKLTLLNIIEVVHPNLLENNQVSESMLDNISRKISEDEEFNDYVDALIRNEVDEYIKNNNIEEDEEQI